MSNTNQKKTAQLGMPLGTAANRLRKLVLFSVLQRHDENVCYRCAGTIETADELSMDHKAPWLDVDSALFWDITNIAFAHLTCNSRDARRDTPAKLAQYESLRVRNTLARADLSPASVERYERAERSGKPVPMNRPPSSATLL